MIEPSLQDQIDRAVARALDKHTANLVDQVADRVERRFLENVGRHVITRVLKWVGAATVGLSLYLLGSGVIKL